MKSSSWIDCKQQLLKQFEVISVSGFRSWNAAVIEVKHGTEPVTAPVVDGYWLSGAATYGVEGCRITRLSYSVLRDDRSMPCFPRGNGPLISVLLPTRGRPEGMREAVLSIWSNTFDKDLIEFLLWIDDDDFESARAADLLRTEFPINIQAWIKPRGNGYFDSHVRVNGLSKEAKGDWLLLWNDDAFMQTPGWDQMLRGVHLYDVHWHGCKDVCLIRCQDDHLPDQWEFFFLRRKVVELLDHYSLHTHCDNWQVTLMRFFNCCFTLPIKFRHKADEMKDKTWEEGREAYKRAGAMLYAPETMRQRQADLNILIDYVEKNGFGLPQMVGCMA